MSEKTATGLEAVRDRLDDPATAEKLGRILDRLDDIDRALDRIDALAALVDQAPGFIAMAVDSVDQVVNRAEAAGIDIDARIRSTYGLGEKLTSPETVDALGNVLDPGAVSVVGMLGQTLVKCREQCLSQTEPPSAGVVDLWKLSRSEDGRRAIAFLVNFGRIWGEDIKTMHGEYRASLEGDDQRGANG